jgi:hypothetical protein
VTNLHVAPTSFREQLSANSYRECVATLPGSLSALGSVPLPVHLASLATTEVEAQLQRIMSSLTAMLRTSSAGTSLVIEDDVDIVRRESNAMLDDELVCRALNAISKPTSREEKPLPFDPDDYPVA